ncbi:hypothetical protein CEXT_57711 [Caerostris extrusa]|uniref:Uncharacterized protein n=1 Tax=Caerostris extrusa TaxID=172846 RepID=A0AAV4XHF7_CAEEX|nr:hypothetical protein CEXT_57711 [Caerostris extrusa]
MEDNVSFEINRFPVRELLTLLGDGEEGERVLLFPKQFVATVKPIYPQHVIGSLMNCNRFTLSALHARPLLAEEALLYLQVL